MGTSLASSSEAQLCPYGIITTNRKSPVYQGFSVIWQGFSSFSKPKIEPRSSYFVGGVIVTTKIKYRLGGLSVRPRNQDISSEKKKRPFFVPKIRKEVAEMTNRNRANPVQFYLSDDEQYILNTKFKASGMKSMSALLRKLILYGYVYDVDYSYLRNYNTELGRISSNLNQIAKRVNSTGNIYQEDINEVKEMMNEVWHTQKSMLSKQPLIKP